MERNAMLSVVSQGFLMIENSHRSKLPVRIVLTILFAGSIIVAEAANIVRVNNGGHPGTQCPGVGNIYRVENYNCSPVSFLWEADGGTIIGTASSSEVDVVWDDEIGLQGTISVTVTCGSGDNQSTFSLALHETILSIKEKEWGLYNDNYSANFCAPAPLAIIMPRMTVDGNGDEVRYEWTIPSGWTTPNLITSIPSILITPTACAVPGEVTVQGIYCPFGDPSVLATITINAADPSVSLSAGGFSVSKPCDTTPVTFTANMTVAPSCISNFTWSFPAGWKWWNSTQWISGPAVTSTNQVSLQPSGTSADAGNLTVQVSFSCGTVVSSDPYAITFIPPSVFTGANPLCTTGQFTVTNTGPGVLVYWTSSNPAVMTISSTGIGTRVGTNAGSVTVSAILGCGAVAIPKTIWVGWPDPSNNSLVYEGLHPGSNPITLTVSTAYQFGMQPVAGASTYNWQIPRTGGWSFWVYGAQANPNVIITGSVAGSYQLICKPGNACGIAGSRALSVTLVPGGGGGGGNPLSVSDPVNHAEENEARQELKIDEPGLSDFDQAELRIFPNPVDNELTISMKKPLTVDSQVRINDLNGRTLVLGAIPAGQSQARFSVEQLIVGVYVIRVESGNSMLHTKLFVMK